MPDEWDHVLGLINDSWPYLQITKKDLLRPTSSMVVNVYNNFVMEFEEKAQFLAGPYCYTTEPNENLDAEERLFYRIYHIFDTFEKNMSNQHMIMLSDIYDPVPIRTKNFFKICSHLVSFVENILEESEALAGNVIKMKVNSNLLENEREKVLSEIDLRATRKTELLEEKEILNQELSKIKGSHEEVKNNMQLKEISYSKKKKEIELLRQQLQLEEQELNRLENKEKELSEQVITESEYINLKHIIEACEIEFKSLGNDQVGMDDLLVHENDELLHFQDIRKRVPEDEDFDLEIVKTVIEHEEELKDIQIENEKLINNIVNPLEVVKTQSEITLEEIKQQVVKENQEYQNMLKKIGEDELAICEQIIKLRDKYKINSNQNTKTVQRLENEIEKLNADRSALRFIFQSEYIKIAEADAKVKEYFKHLLSKIN